jgi:hypothetical protein
MSEIDWDKPIVDGLGWELVWWKEIKAPRNEKGFYFDIVGLMRDPNGRDNDRPRCFTRQGQCRVGPGYNLSNVPPTRDEVLHQRATSLANTRSTAAWTEPRLFDLLKQWDETDGRN